MIGERDEREQRRLGQYVYTGTCRVQSMEKEILLLMVFLTSWTEGVTT